MFNINILGEDNKPTGLLPVTSESLTSGTLKPQPMQSNNGFPGTYPVTSLQTTIKISPRPQGPTVGS